MNNINTWLVSNSSLYFADRLLQGLLPVNAYNIFDLSKLSECLLLADKIYTLPGRGTEIELYEQLKNGTEIKIEELNVNDGTVENIVGNIREGDDYIYSRLKPKDVVKLFCDIFPIKEQTIGRYTDDDKEEFYKQKKVILDAITYTTEWANRNWYSTSRYMDSWFRKPIHQEDSEFEIIRSTDSANINSNFSKYYIYQDLITDTYLRTLLYLRISSHYQLNYFPDSLRVPLVEYIDKALCLDIKKFAQQLINIVEGKKSLKMR